MKPNIKIVIACAGSKVDTGRMKRDEHEIEFVAHPHKAPSEPGRLYAHPDDKVNDNADDDQSWRQKLCDYNKKYRNKHSDNPLNLNLAYLLYKPKIYKQLVEHYGCDNVFILSAGWGLLNASFLTPHYDITFSKQAESYKRRALKDKYEDLFCLPPSDDKVVFFGGKDYLPLFLKLTKNYKARCVFYNSADKPCVPQNCTLRRYETRTRTNWHYCAAQDFMAGKITCS